MAIAWYANRITVPFGDPSYDTAYGGAHDLDIGLVLNTPITAILPGTVVSITSPTWGQQIGIKLDVPFSGAPYMAFLHLSAVNPVLQVGSHVNVGDLIGWSGGATNPLQYLGTSNPTGTNFVDTSSQSSQPQVGIALMRGPEYGVGAGWTSTPDPTLDPTPLLNQLLGGTMTQQTGTTDWLNPVRIIKLVIGILLLAGVLWLLANPEFATLSGAAKKAGIK